MSRSRTNKDPDLPLAVHSHASHRPYWGGSGGVSSRATRLITALALLGLGATLVGMILLRPTADPTLLGLTRLGPQYDAVVDRSDVGPCPGQEEVDPQAQVRCLNLRMELLAGPDAGRATHVSLPDSPSTPRLRTNDKVVLAYEPDAPEGLEYRFLDRQRKPVLFWLAVLFALAVVALGRLRGVAALGGLVVTVVVLLTFVLPAITTGRSPVLVAVVGASLITFATLYLSHGFTHMTTTALLGTLVSLGLTALMAQLFVGLAQISGFATDEAILLNLESGTIDIAGLVLAGVIIGALGALDDVTVTQASAVWELQEANPSRGTQELFRSGLRIGRDHIAATVNTLLLAYAGAAMPLLLFFVVSEQPLASVANEEIVATEIVRTLVGSIGLVASVPVTTWIAARIASSRSRKPAPGTA